MPVPVTSAAWRCTKSSVSLKILLVIFRADPARGGAERYTIDLAESLTQRGHDVTLAASAFAAGIRGVNIAARGATRTGRYRKFLDNLDRHLNESHYDIVHAMLPVRRCDVYHPHAGIAAEAIESGHLKHGGAMQLAARFANRLNRKRIYFAQIEREMLSSPRPPLVLCLSDYVAGNLRRHYPDARCAKLFNAVDLDKFDPARRIDAGMTIRRQLGISAGKTIALMIAQDFRRKGLPEALAAMARVDDPQLLLVVVGKEDPAPYQRLAEQLRIADRVVFAGQTDDPYAFYKAADLFVLPTRHDPCSLVVLEALAMGLPVISTNRNGACEIMTDGVHGSVLTDPEDVEGLSAALRKWLDPGPRRTASDLCLALRPQLSHVAHVGRLLELYHNARG